MDWREPTHRDAFPTIGLERSRCILNPNSSSITHEQSVPGRSRFHHPVETSYYVSNIPADDPNGDVARNVSTDKGCIERVKVRSKVVR